MLDPRTLELIHAELDGELDPAAAAELDRRLEAADARRMREDLQRVARALERMVPAEPPLTLRNSVLNGIRPLARPAPTRARILRHGWSIAAGIGVGAIGTLALLELDSPGAGQPRFDPGELAGAIAHQAFDPIPAIEPALRLATTELHGTVTVQAADRLRVLSFELDSPAPVSVQAHFEPVAFRFLGFVPGDGDATSLSTSPGSVAIVNHGSQRFALFFRPDAGGPIRLRFEAGGRVLHEASLAMPASVPGAGQ